MRRTPSRRGRVLALALVVAAALAAFWPVLHHDFDEYDDTRYVTGNRHVKDGLSAAGLRWAWTSFHASNWHPLTWMSHMLDWQLFGPAAAGHHLTSLLLHLLNACLLFLLLDRATGATGRSAVVAALFAVHPLHVESVAWVAERKDVLSTLFWMLAALAHVRGARSGRTRDRIAVAVFFGLGLCAKPMLVTLPFTLLLLDYWPLGRWTAGPAPRSVPRIPAAVLREKLPLFLMAAASCVVTLAAQRGAIGSLERYPLAARAANAVISYVAYLGKTLWPGGLAVFYPFPRTVPPPWEIAGASALLVLATALALSLRRARPYLTVGWLWYLGTLVPVIGLVQVGQQAAADRYTYVPLIGIFVAAVWGVADGLRLAVAGGRRSRVAAGPGRGDSPWLILPAVAVVVPLAIAARIQLGHWRDAVTLFERAAAVADSGVARTNLGEALLNRGRTADAEVQFRKALEIDPTVYQAHNSLGLILEGEGRADEALRHYDEAVRLRPGYGTAHRNLGRLLASLGRIDDAIAEDRRALELDAGDAEAHANLGAALASKGRLDDAVTQYEAALRIDPGDARVHNNLGSALSRLGRQDDALRHFAEAVRLRPDYGTAHYNLATALFFQGRYAEAWREVHAARRLGFAPQETFLRMLEAKLPDPGGPG